MVPYTHHLAPANENYWSYTSAQTDAEWKTRKSKQLRSTVGEVGPKWESRLSVNLGTNNHSKWKHGQITKEKVPDKAQ